MGSEQVDNAVVRSLLADDPRESQCAHVVLEDDNVDDWCIDADIKRCESWIGGEQPWDEGPEEAARVVPFLHRLRAATYEERVSWVGLRNQCWSLEVA